jgi:Activator of Hsp90 ATPase homolog 1-like protein
MSALPPVHRSLTVPLDIEAAFDLFVRRISEWWPLEMRSVSLADAVSAHIEERVGGRVFERTRDGREILWGTITHWEPPARFALTWHPGQPEATAQVVELRFTVVEDGTCVELEHRHWERAGERAEFLRQRYDQGWQPILERYCARARGETRLPEVTGAGCREEAMP